MDKPGSDPTVIGQTVTLSGEAYTVIAVMPAYVDFPAPGVQAWVPLIPLPGEQSDRGAHMFEVIGRLKPDVSIEQARREMVLIARRIRAAIS